MQNKKKHLFVLAIKILAISLRVSPDIKGIKIGKVENKISLLLMTPFVFKMVK